MHGNIVVFCTILLVAVVLAAPLGVADSWLPDLTVDTAFPANESVIYAGTQIMIRSQLSNIGTGQAGPFCTLLDPGDGNSQAFCRPNLWPGQHREEGFWHVYAEAGTYDSRVVVDVNQAANEEDETNNELASVVQVLPAIPVADVAFVPLSVPENATNSEPVLFVFGIRNDGTAIAAHFCSRFFSGEGSPQTTCHDELLPGEQVNDTFAVTYANNLWKTWFLGLDTDNELLESNETNNFGEGHVFVHPRETLLADLRFVEYELLPTIVTVGMPATFMYHFGNFGNAPANAFCTTFQSGVSEWDTRCNNYQLAPGEETTESFTVTYTEPGEHVVAFSLDSMGWINESDEYNNRVTRMVTVQPQPLPDLVVEQIATLPLRPQPGQLFSSRVVVKNIGTAAADGSCTRVTFSTPDAFLQSRLVCTQIPLPPGQRITLLVQTTWPQAGIRTVSAYADVNTTITELDETNNERSVPVRQISVALE